MTSKISYPVSSKYFAISSIMAITAFILMMPSVSAATTLSRELQTGMRGADVTALQGFLAQDPTLYPQGLVTGYFGYLTKAAVSNFQSRNEISPVGRVGPATLPVINFQMLNGLGMGAGSVNNTGTNAPIITAIGITPASNSTIISWNTNETVSGMVYYSNVPLLLTEHLNSVESSGNTISAGMNGTYQSVTLPNLQANTTYYYMIYTTDLAGNVSVSWPSTFRTNY